MTESSIELSDQRGLQELTRIAHIVNPYRTEAGSFDGFVQAVTFESMIRAAANVASTVEVVLLTAQSEGDHGIAPAEFTATHDLVRSATDIGEFSVKRPLPLLADILERLHGVEADYYVYSNVDIGLTPQFYQVLSTLLERGHDAIVINRRTISDGYESLDEIPLMCSEVGERHPGWDLFAYSARIGPLVSVRRVLVGASHVGLALIANLVALAAKFIELRDVHLTFHLGDERSWRSPTLDDYADWNKAEASRVVRMLVDEYGEFSDGSPPGRFLNRKRIITIAYEWSYDHFPVLTRKIVSLRQLLRGEPTGIKDPFC